MFVVLVWPCFVYLVRRNTSVDESYEWDSADACVDSEVLEANRFGPSHTGFRRGRGDLRCDQAGGLRDQQQKGDLTFPTCWSFTSCYMLHAAVTPGGMFSCCDFCTLIPWHSHPCLSCPWYPPPGPSPPVSPPVSNPPRCESSLSLSEARFNALRLEYQEYRRAQASMCSRVSPDHDSDSDSSSALL